MSSTGQIKSIQSLRGFAALAVVVCHAYPGSAYSYPIGRMGVELFFVISGFVMAYIWGRPEPFLLRRALRIYPMYWIIAVPIALVLWFKGAEPSAAALMLLPVSGEQTILSVAWTLSHEMFFYLLLAVMPRRHALPLASAAIVALVLYGLIYGPSGVFGELLTSPINLCFVAGIAAAQVRLNFSPGLLAISALGLAALCLFGAPANDADYRYLWFGIPAAGLLLAVRDCPLRLLRLEQLGDASYSLYLIHIPVMAVVKFGTTEPIVLIAASVIVGFIVYAVVERPISGWLQRRKSAGPAPSLDFPPAAIGPNKLN